ncbi:hypothetical protein [Edaphobacter dinghuensis]|uniref:Uncharacterized protein n=1 Tax=Edaphobacter dinghuensis TaxID=1560005 RepID=A0A917H3P0_9BACT|nr:hypothetical protein [Edaphobacter dinghuensis]GGG65962.1 hypothetical protein GCM10011585_04700 [Edaphobacter dinghuensis]
MSAPVLVNAVAPVTRRVRAYFAPVNRATGTPAVFDAAQSGSFALNAAPAPWIDLGWCTGFARKSATKIEALRTGAPAVVQTQVRSEIEATVSLAFESWGKLQMALAAGSQQMNLLATANGAIANGSGGIAAAPVPLAAGSTATSLNVGAATAGFNVGDLVAVDLDYTGQVGFVGSGVSGAYVASAVAVNDDINYVRRVSLNVSRVTAIANGALQLSAALPAGAPATGMQVSRLAGFVDREGGSWFQEWSALFVMQGEQGDRVIYHYPRLQPMQSAAESAEVLAGTLEQIRLTGAFRALPVKDANDGETVVCFRSYLPAAMRSV